MAYTYSRVRNNRKSFNAEMAEEDGRYPASRWASILRSRKTNRFKSITAGDIMKAVPGFEWHHTGKFANETKYYSLDEIFGHRHEILRQIKTRKKINKEVGPRFFKIGKLTTYNNAFSGAIKVTKGNVTVYYNSGKRIDGAYIGTHYYGCVFSKTVRLQRREDNHSNNFQCTSKYNSLQVNPDSEISEDEFKDYLFEMKVNCLNAHNNNTLSEYEAYVKNTKSSADEIVIMLKDLEPNLSETGIITILKWLIDSKGLPYTRSRANLKFSIDLYKVLSSNEALRSVIVDEISKYWWHLTPTQRLTQPIIKHFDAEKAYYKALSAEKIKKVEMRSAVFDKDIIKLVDNVCQVLEDASEPEEALDLNTILVQLFDDHRVSVKEVDSLTFDVDVRLLPAKSRKSLRRIFCHSGNGDIRMNKYSLSVLNELIYERSTNPDSERYRELTTQIKDSMCSKSKPWLQQKESLLDAWN